VSGTLGALLGGVGGAMIYYPCMQISGNPAQSAIFALGIFFVQSVIPSWNIQGTIEGFHDPKSRSGHWPLGKPDCRNTLGHHDCIDSAIGRRIDMDQLKGFTFTPNN